MFNPHPTIEIVPLFDGHHALVIDDALQDPDGWRRWSAQQHQRFQPSGLAYPGVELWLAEQAMGRYAEFFAEHVRGRLGARRTINVAARMSLVTLPPQALAPRQWQCHRDNRGLPDSELMIASVIYLFEDPALGGTSFYKPRRSAADTEAMMQDAGRMTGPEFRQRHPDIEAGYLVDSNPWFERMATLAPRWNRAVFYDGGLFHSGDIRHPARMTADAATGRLTMNGFMRCRRAAA